MRLATLLKQGVVLPELSGTTTEEVVGEMIDALIELARYDAARRDDTFIALLKRESTGTTGLGAGIAMPHAKLAFLPDFVCGMALSKAGVDFRSSDRRPVHAVFLLLSPSDDPYGHLNLMGIIAGLARKPGLVEAIQHCRTAEACIERIAEMERALFPEA